MQMPDIKILNTDLELLNEIDLYTSLDFKRSWQGTGDFTLVVCGNCECLQVGNIIMLSGDGHKCGIIRSVNKVVDDKGVTVTAAGQTLNGLTSQRVVLPYEGEADGGYFAVPRPSSSSKTASAETIIKTFISACMGAGADDNRKIKNSSGKYMLTVPENQKRGIQTNWASRYGKLDEELQSLCEYCDCGYEFYINLGKRTFVCEYLPGVDRTVSRSENGRVILSKDFESINNVTYNIDFSNYKNLAYCGGSGDSWERTVLAVTPDTVTSTPAGFTRYETFLDCGTLESVETETAISLQDEGKHKLEEYDFTESLTATISQSGSFKYGEQYNLGDLVTVVDKGLNLQQDMRISEVTESYEPDKYSVSVTFGTVPKRLGRVIKSLKLPVK